MKKPVDENSFPERFHRFVNRLMGVKRRPDPRTSDVPIFATFQDRVFASALDLCVIYLIFGDLLRWVSAMIYQGADETTRFAMPAELEHAPIARQVEYFVGHLFESGFAQLWILNSFAQSALIGVLLVAVWSHFHATPGKFIIGLRFACEHGEGTPDLRRYIRRFLAFYLSMPFFMIGFAASGFDREKRAWHDRIAGTTVIYTREGHIFRRGWDLLKSLILGKK